MRRTLYPTILLALLFSVFGSVSAQDIPAPIDVYPLPHGFIPEPLPFPDFPLFIEPLIGVDLEITEAVYFRYDGLPFRYGEPVNIIVRIKNHGISNSGLFLICLHHESAYPVDPEYARLKTSLEGYEETTIAMGQYVFNSVGTTPVIFEIDCDDEVTESNELNNGFSSSITLQP